MLAAVVFFVAALEALRIARYKELAWPGYGVCERQAVLYYSNPGGPMYVYCGHVTPWWAIPAAVAVCLLGLLLAAVIYPRRRAASSESWLPGFRDGNGGFHRALPPRSN